MYGLMRDLHLMISSGQGAFGTHQRCLDGVGTAFAVEMINGRLHVRRLIGGSNYSGCLGASVYSDRNETVLRLLGLVLHVFLLLHTHECLEVTLDVFKVSLLTVDLAISFFLLFGVLCFLLIVIVVCRFLGAYAVGSLRVAS